MSRQRLSGAPGSLEASWLPLQHWVHAACLCALQALKRKPDLFLCSNLDVKAVFQCGEYHGHGHVLQITLRRSQPALPVELDAEHPRARDHRTDLGWPGVFWLLIVIFACRCPFTQVSRGPNSQSILWLFCEYHAILESSVRAGKAGVRLRLGTTACAGTERAWPLCCRRSCCLAVERSPRWDRSCMRMAKRCCRQCWR